MNWYFPKDISEAVELAVDGVLFHAGGTAIRRRGLANVKGLIDLGRLSLNCFKSSKGQVEIGAMCSFQDVIDGMSKVDADSILVQSLRQIPPALRNRITVGGSIAAFHAWTDLVGPLVAYDAEIVLAGKSGGSQKLADYLAKDSHKGKALITAVKFDAKGWMGVYHREVRTNFDYSAFNVSMQIKRSGSKVDDARAVIVGCKDRFARLVNIEDILKSGKPTSFDLDIEFNPKKHGSAEYLKHVAKTEVERGIGRLLKAQ